MRLCPWVIDPDYRAQETVPDLVTRNVHTVIKIELELSFANKPLRQLCESSVKANRKLGVDIGARDQSNNDQVLGRADPELFPAEYQIPL
jgi:hypothetical protein